MESQTLTLAVSATKEVRYLGTYLQEGLRPPPRLTVAEWSEKYRKLPRVAAAEPGLWRNDRTPYLVEIMEELSPSSHAERVVFMKGSQIGATEIGVNWLLYSMHAVPVPMLSVQPTIDIAKRFSKQRLSHSINECEPLRDLVYDNKSRDRSNTVLQKDFPGGTLINTGANSAAALRSMPICNLMADEVDAWPPDADGEGSPLELARRRLATFGRKKEFIASTPTIAGMSVIENEFEGSDQRYYFVPCPYCGHLQTITWDKLHFEDRKPGTVRMKCESCEESIREYHKTEMLRRGQWIATNPKGLYPGFHLSALYSPLGWYSWKDAVADHIAALGDPMRRKVWVNTVLGELWDEAASTVDHHFLMKRREKYEAQVPGGVLCLTAGVDTQDDRLEATVYGWGLEYENWHIEHKTFFGDPGQSDVWDDLDAYLQTEFEHATGAKIMIATTCVDAMGHHTDQVYDFCKPRLARRIFAVQGMGGAGRPLVIRYSKNNRKKVYLFQLGVDQGKETLYSRLKIKDVGPGYCHFPEEDGENFFLQLTAEKRVMKNNNGIPKLRWVLPPGKRNEALDCSVYSMAALAILNPNFALLAEQNLIYSGKPAAANKRARKVYSKGVK